MTDTGVNSGEPPLANPAASIDPELHALTQIIALLEPLNPEARERVLAYVFQRLSIKSTTRSVTPQHFSQVDAMPVPVPAFDLPQSNVRDIRSFAEEKMPESATEKAALVAFFLDEVAPHGERKSSIGQDDVTKYFKQAGFPLPASPSMTLVHAKNAGYFEAIGPGQYRLNPVGYNLVAHRLPKAVGSVVAVTNRSKRPAKKAAKRAIKGAVKKAKN